MRVDQPGISNRPDMSTSVASGNRDRSSSVPPIAVMWSPPVTTTAPSGDHGARGVHGDDASANSSVDAGTGVTPLRG